MRRTRFTLNRLGSLATMALLGSVVLAACGSEAAQEEAQDVTRVPVTYVAQATPEEAEPEEAAGGASPAAPPAAAAGDVERGQELASSQCFSCHSIDGSTLVGPTWQGLFGREEELESGETVVVDEAYITESIRDPNAKIVAGFPAAMPPFPDLSDQDIQDIIAYIQSLE